MGDIKDNLERKKDELAAGNQETEKLEGEKKDTKDEINGGEETI